MATDNALKQLLVDELRDLLDAEKQLTRALPKMARAASAAPLRAAFERHLRETEGQVSRLERALRALDASVRGKPCAGMKGLVAEGQEMMAELEGDPVRDAALIVAAQKVEHYEIAAYGSCKAFAELLGAADVVTLVDETLAEEKAADQKLTELAEGQVNRRASAAAPDPGDADGIFARAAEWVRAAMGNGQKAASARRRPRSTAAARGAGGSAQARRVSRGRGAAKRAGTRKK